MADIDLCHFRKDAIWSRPMDRETISALLSLKEFKTGVIEHPVTAKIFQIQKIDAILELM